MIHRFYFLMVIFLAVFFLPWLAIGLSILGLLFFSFYLEAIVALLLIDSLYALPQSGFFTGQFIFTIGGLVLLIVIEYSKDRLFRYN